MVVIGGKTAGMSAASAARRVQPDMETVVVERDAYISYESRSLPYYISDDIKHVNNLVSLTPEVAQRELGIRVLTRHESLEIDPKNKKVLVRNLLSGKESDIPYHKLVIATGALPIQSSIPGSDLRNIFTVRTLSDGMAIKKFISDWPGFNASVRLSGPCGGYLRTHKRAMKAVIVGGGYIGMGMCESLRKRGLKVTVLEKMERILGTMDLDITKVVEKKLENEGVTLLKGVSVERFIGRDGAVETVVTDKGKFDADLVLLTIGIRPNVELAKKTGVALGVGGAIKVDKYLQTNITGVYAAGDCAEAVHFVTGKKVCNCFGTTANRQGKMAGENVAGMRKIFKGVVGTIMAKIFDLEVGRTGLSALDAERDKYVCFSSTAMVRSTNYAYPNGKPIVIRYTVERATGKLLGAEMVGEEGVAHRIDTLAACLHAKMTIEDVANLDLGYAPPFITVRDPILTGANAALRKWKQ